MVKSECLVQALSGDCIATHVTRTDPRSCHTACYVMVQSYTSMQQLTTQQSKQQCKPMWQVSGCSECRVLVMICL